LNEEKESELMSNDSLVTSLYVASNDDVKEKWLSFVEQFDKQRFMISSSHPLIQYYLNHMLKEDEPIWLDEGNIFVRARINNSEPYREFQSKDLHAPPNDKVGHGRLNPKGISFLYVAAKEKTAACIG